eukprot:GEMP01011198.1.p1 GENE.GEMP01011198.1~~GEMP01011198.1.p1  ORF type:complete len:310 (+),score=42.14 GEMP01011198.1:60-932(+)
MLFWISIATVATATNWCLELDLICDDGVCSCARRLAASEQADANAGSPVVETRITQATIPPCASGLPWWLLPMAFLLGMMLGTCLMWLCVVPAPAKTRRVTRESKLGGGELKFSDKKSLHAEFTEEQFHELCKNIALKSLIITEDVECFTRQGPTSEIMYGTICKGWQLWQLHSSIDDDDPEQEEEAVREMVRCGDGLAFPMTGYFFVESDEFEEAARRAQELEITETAPLLDQGAFSMSQQPPLFALPGSQYPQLGPAPVSYQQATPYQQQQFPGGYAPPPQQQQYGAF